MSTAKKSRNTEIEPFKEQEPFLGVNARYYSYISGVGAGKTAAGILRTIFNMEEWNPGEMGAIIAPTKTMIKDVIIPVMREWDLFDYWEYRGPHSDEPGIHSPNGSRALLLSADNKRTINRLKGLNLSWWWIDEEAEVAPRARQILTQRLRVGQYRNGYATTTPKGFNHSYDFWVEQNDGELKQHGQADVLVSKDKVSLLRVPSFANPHTDDDYKEDLKRQHSGTDYEQEVMGEFTQYEGLVHSWFDHRENVKPVPWIRDKITVNDSGTVRSSYDKLIYGMDWGFSTDPAACVVIVLKGGTTYVIDEFKERGMTNQDLANQVQDLQSMHGHGPVYCDPAEPASIEVFRRAGIDAYKADNSVSEGLQAVRQAANNGIYVNENCVEWINEVQSYRYKDDPKDDSDVMKQSDHLMDATRYALFSNDVGGHSSTNIIGGDVI